MGSRSFQNSRELKVGKSMMCSEDLSYLDVPNLPYFQCWYTHGPFYRRAFTLSGSLCPPRVISPSHWLSDPPCLILFQIFGTVEGL